MPPADDELLRRIAGSDAEAFASLYRRYARTVYGDSEIAEQLELPLETVKARTCSALRHLAAGLDSPGA